MRDVDLVEVDSPDVAPGPPAPAGRTPHGSPTRRRRATATSVGRPSHRAAWAVSVAVIVLGTVVNGVTNDPVWPRDDELARSPGVLVRVTGPVAEAWSRPVSLWAGAVGVDGLVVGVENVRSGSTRVVALRADTGDVVWRTGLSPDRRASPLGCAGTGLAAAGAPRGPRVVECLVSEHASARVDRPDTKHVVRLEATSGAVLDRRVVDATAAGGTWQALLSRPASSVTLGDGPPASITISRSGALTVDAGTAGSPRWTVDGSFTPMDVLVVGQKVLTSDEHTVTCYDAATGATLWEAPVERAGRTAMVTDGRLVLVTGEEPSGDVVVTALAVADGRPRWRADIGDDLRLVVLGNRLYGQGPDRLVALR